MMIISIEHDPMHFVILWEVPMQLVFACTYVFSFLLLYKPEKISTARAVT